MRLKKAQPLALSLLFSMQVQQWPFSVLDWSRFPASFG